MKKRLFSAITIAAITLLSSTAVADNGEDLQLINMEGIVLEGEHAGSDLEVYRSHSSPDFDRLLQLHRDFRDEINEDAEGL